MEGETSGQEGQMTNFWFVQAKGSFENSDFLNFKLFTVQIDDK